MYDFIYVLMSSQLIKQYIMLPDNFDASTCTTIFNDRYIGFVHGHITDNDGILFDVTMLNNQ